VCNRRSDDTAIDDKEEKEDEKRRKDLLLESQAVEDTRPIIERDFKEHDDNGTTEKEEEVGGSTKGWRGKSTKTKKRREKKIYDVGRDSLDSNEDERTGTLRQLKKSIAQNSSASINMLVEKVDDMLNFAKLLQQAKIEKLKAETESIRLENELKKRKLQDKD